MASVAVLTVPGQFDSLLFQPVEPSPLLSHEVEIQVEAAALNFKDILLALGLIPTPTGISPVFGFECSGTVRAVGGSVTAFVPGDRVLAIGGGCLATSVRVDAGTVAHRPRSLSALQAVTLPIAFATASYAMEELARLRSGDSVLIHAATGGVGLAAVQIAQRLGAEIFATAGSEDKRDYLRSLGIAHVMNSRTPNFADQILATTNGRGVDVVLNSLSGDLLQRSLDVLAPHGRFVELGARDAIAGHTIALSLFRRGASFCAVGYEGPLPRLGARLADVVARAETGEFQPLPMRAFGLSEAGAAFAWLAAARHIGKVVVEVSAALENKPGKINLENMLSSAEGVRLFEMCLSGNRTNFAVSKVPLAARLGSRALATRPEAEPPSDFGRRHARPALKVAFAEPRTPVESKIAQVWAKHFGLESVGVNDDFFDLGGDSLLAVQVAYSLRSALSIDIPTHLLLENSTIAALASHLDGAPAGLSVSRHLVQLAKGPANTTPIFLVHPIGGHVYFYLPLAKQLSATAPVYGLQAQGVDGEAPPLSTIEEMASGYIAAMRSIQPRGPWRLGGSSFGGVVCFEMARQLTEAGDSLDLLALIDSPTPSSLGSFFRSDAEILAYLLARGESTDNHLRELSVMSEDQMLRYFLVQGGAGERLAPDATVESVRHFLHLFRANYEALVKYQPRHSESRGVFFHATEHDSFNPDGFEHAWTPFFSDLELVAVPGNHTTMNLPPNCDGMVRRIQTILNHEGTRP